jgi:hypothetical protein
MHQSLTLPSRTRCHTSQNLAKSVPALTQDKFNFFLPSLRYFIFSQPTDDTKPAGQKQRKPLLAV